MTRITGAVRGAGCAALLALAVATCTDDPTGPRRLRAFLSVSPSLPASASNLAAFGLSVDSIRVVVVRPPSDTLANTKVPFPANLDSIALPVPLSLENAVEMVTVTIELRGGGFVLFSGSTTVEVRAGPPGATPTPNIALSYTGPGTNITSLVVSPLDSVVRQGDSLRFRVDAFAGQTPVTMFYVSWSSDNETLAPINAHGVLRAPPARGSVTVMARTPTNVTGSTQITFVPLPSAVQIVSPVPPLPIVQPGAAVGPLRVKVIALDGLGVKGVPVTFQSVTSGGSVTSAIVVSDDSGFAQTDATVGTIPGPSVFTATVSGLTPATFSFTVAGGGGGATQLAFVSPPGGGLAGVTLPPVFVALQDAQGGTVVNATTPVTIALGANPGGATLGGTLTRTPSEGLVSFNDLVIDNPGTGYTLVVTASGLTPATSPPFDVITGLAGRLWTNPAGGNWSNPANWSGGIVPGPQDTVFITLDGTYTVTLDVNAVVAFLYIGGATGTQTLSAVSLGLQADSVLSIGPSGALDVTSATIGGVNGVVLNQGTMRLQNVVVASDLLNGGSWIARSAVDVQGTVSQIALATLRVEGDQFCCSATLTAVTIANQGSIELTAINGSGAGATISVPGGALLNLPGATITSAAGAGGTRLLDAELDNQGTVVIEHPLTISRGSVAHFNDGTIQLTTGDLAIAQSGVGPSFTTGGTIVVGAGRTLSVTGGDFAYNSPAPGGLGGFGTASFTNVNLDLSTDLANDSLTLGFLNTTVSGSGVLSNAAGRTLTIQSTILNTDIVNQGMLVVRGASAMHGALTAAAGGTIQIQGDQFCCSGSLTVDNGFTNEGLIELTAINGTGASGDLTVVSGTLINAPGATLAVRQGAGGNRNLDAAVDNRGTLLIEQSLSLNKPSVDYVNTGTVRLTTGDLTINQTGTSPSFTTAGTVVVAAGRVLQVNGGLFHYANLAPGGLAGNGAVNFAGANIILTPSTTNDTLSLGFLSSTIDGPGVLTNVAGRTLTMQQTTLNAPFNNQGTLVSRGSSVLGGAVTTFPGSVIQVQADQFCCSARLFMAVSLTNHGLLELTSINGTGAGATLEGAALVNEADGTVAVRAGAGGSRFIETQLDNRGALVIEQTTTLDADGADHVNSGTIQITGGDLAILQGGSTPTFTTTGSIIVAAGRQLAVTNGAFDYANAAPGGLAGLGSVSFSGVTVSLTPALANDTLALGFLNSVVSGPGSLTNAANRSLTAQQTAINAPFINHGRFIVRGASSLNGTVTAASDGTIEVQADQFCCSSALTVATGFSNSGLIELTSINGTGASADINVTAGSLVNEAGATLAVRAGAGGNRTIGAQIDNRGTLLIEHPASINKPAAAHVNSGSIQVTGGDLDIVQSSFTPTFSTTGSIVVQAGRTLAVSQGTFNYANAAPGGLGGLGTVSVNGATINLTPDLTADTLELAITNSTINGPGKLTNAVNHTLTIQQTTINAPFENRGLFVSRGINTLGGTVTAAATGTIQVQADQFCCSAQLTLATGLTNQGVIELTSINGTGATATLEVSTGFLVNASGATLSVLPGAGGTRVLNAALNNQGTVNLGTSLILNATSADHINGGSILVAGGDLTISQSGTTPTFTNQGLLDIAASRTTQVSGGAFTNDQTGTISGSGTFDRAAAGAFNQNGSINPGGSPGTLTVVGDLPASATSVLNVEIGGLLTTQYDRVVVAGAVTTDGTLNVTLVNGFTPTIGDAFTIVQAGSRTGTFSGGLNLPTVAGAIWQPTLNGTTVQLTLVSASALAPVQWVNAAGGAWSNGANWSTGTAPGINDSAVIHLSSSYTVTVDVNASVGFLDLGGPIGGTRTLDIATNTLTLDKGGGISQAGVINLSGSTLGGGGTIALLGALNWTGGTIAGAGALDVGIGGTITISGASAKSLNAKVIHNDGTVVWSGGNINSGLGAALVNQAGGIAEFQADATWFYNLGGAQPRIDNLGGASINRGLGTGLVTLNLPLNNAGVVNLQSGNFELRAGGTSSGLFAVASGAILDFAQGSPVLATGADISGAGVTRLTAGTLHAEATDTTQLPRLHLIGGTLQGSGALEITDSLVWTGGTMSGTGVTRIAAGADLLINGAVSFASRTISNGGTVVWAGTNQVSSGVGALLRNDAGAVVDLQANAAWFYNLGGSVSRIVNLPGGLVRRSVGTGNADVRSAVDNDGTVAVQSGTLSLGSGGASGGSFTVATNAVLAVTGSGFVLGPTSSLTGTGGVTFAAGTATIGGAYDVTGLTSVTGGSPEFSATDTSRVTSFSMTAGTLGGTGVVLLRSNGTWSGGTMADAGVLRVPAGATFSITGAVSLAGHQIANAGQVIWTGGNLSTGIGAIINNDGLFEARADGSWFNNLGGAALSFNNNVTGTLRRNTGVGTVTLQVPVTNAGLVDVQSGTLQLNAGTTTTGTQNVATGATLQYLGGTHSLSTGSAFTGSGRVLVQGAPIVNVNAVAPDTVDARWIEFASGTLGGPGALRMSDSLVWTGGTVGDVGIIRIPIGARLVMRGGARSFNARAIEVAGVAVWTGAATINSGVDASLRIESGGLLQLESDAHWVFNSGGAAPRIENLAGGTIRRSTATTAINVAAVLNNNGLVDIQTGSVSFQNGGTAAGAATVASTATLGFAGGTHTWGSGSSITGAGTVAVSAGVVTLGGVYNVSGATRLTGGGTNFNTTDTARVTTLDLSGAGILSGAAPVLLNGTGSWTGGSMSGSGALVIPAGRTLVIGGVASKAFNTRTIAAAGTLSWTGGTITGSGGSVNIASGGTFGVEGDGSWGTGTTVNIAVGGVLKRSVGAGVAAFAAVVNNNGTVDATSGTLALNGGGGGTGTYLASNLGATLQFGAGTHTLTAGAKINGVGLVDFANATVSIGGTGSSYDVVGTTQVTNGSVTFNTPDTTRFTTLQLRGGIITGSANMVLRGTGLWTGGTLAAPTGLPGAVHLRIPQNATLDIAGTASHGQTIRQIVNLGNVNWLSGNVISNNALFDNRPDATLTISTPGNSWSGTGTNTILNQSRANILVLSGTSTIAATVLIDNSGILDIGVGASLKLTTGALFNNRTGGDLQGGGTFDLGGINTLGAVQNTGNVRPGGSPGVLTIVAPATSVGWPQGLGSTLVIDVTGPLLGTEHDQLIVSGLLTSGGALHLVGDFTYQPRTISLPIVLFGSRTGQTFSVSLFNNLPVPILLDYKTTSLSIVW